MNILERVKELNLPLGEYILICGGVLDMYGIRKAGDVDVVGTKKLFKELKRRGWKRVWFFRGALLGRKMIRKPDGTAEALNNLRYGNYYKKAEEMIAMAEMVNGIPCMPLAEIATYKKEFTREKDIRDIKLIEEYLKTHPR